MDPRPLQGSRRELTPSLFEQLCAIQCTPGEIMGHVGTDLPRLERWCRRIYRLPLDQTMEMLRQDGLIEIRRASFELLKRSAPLITQQLNRYIGLPGPTAEEKARMLAEESGAAVRQFVAMISPAPEDVAKLFEEGEEVEEA